LSATFVATGSDTLTDTAYNDPSNTSTLTNITVAPTSTGVPVGANTGLLIACAVAADTNFATTVGDAANGLAGVQGYTAASTSTGSTVDGTIELQVVNTGASIAVQETFFNSVDTAANPVSVASQLLGANQTATLFDNVALTTGNVTAADVGATAYLKVSQNVAASSNPTQAALSVQSGANEGSTVALGIASASAASLRVANINLLLSAASIPSLGAEDAIGQVDDALQRLLAQRAQLGALVTRLGTDADNDATAATNLQASESQVRDLDVGSASTDFTRLQILVQTGTRILQSTNTDAQSVLRLFG
jgi:flagellin